MGRRGAVWVVSAALMLPCRAQAAPPAEAKPPRDPVVRNLTITGGVLTVLGAAGLGLGFGGFGMAGHAQRRLAALSSNQTITGFPVGDWSCRNAAPRDCPRTQWDNMRLGNRLGTTGVLTGSMIAVGGMVFLIVAAQLRAERADASIEDSNGVGTPITHVAPMLVPRGAGLSVELRF